MNIFFIYYYYYYYFTFLGLKERVLATEMSQARAWIIYHIFFFFHFGFGRLRCAAWEGNGMEGKERKIRPDAGDDGTVLYIQCYGCGGW